MAHITHTEDLLEDGFFHDGLNLDHLFHLFFDLNDTLDFLFNLDDFLNLVGYFDDSFNLDYLFHFHDLRHFDDLFYLDKLRNFHDFLNFNDLFHYFFHFNGLDDLSRGDGRGRGTLAAGGQVFHFGVQHLSQANHLLSIRYSQTIFPFADSLTGYFHCSCQLSLGQIALLTQFNDTFTNGHKHLSHFYKISNCWLHLPFYTDYSEKSSFDRGFASAASFSSVLSIWV